MSLILHIETATKVCSAALSRAGNLIGLKELSEDGFAHGEQLTLLIEAVLKECAVSMKELEAVSVSAGPGSYTGLRIGVSTAKGLCYALEIPLIAIDTLESMAVIGKSKYPESTLCPMIDARRMEVYATIFSPGGKALKPLSADVLDESSYQEFEPFVAFGDGAPKMMESWQPRNILFDTELQPSASGQTALAFQKLQRNETEDVAYFEPAYLKEFAGTPPKAR